MLERTARLWEKQDRAVGDRYGLFSAVDQALTIGSRAAVETVLYAGSYVDIAPSFVWPTVTYVDVDRRANQFFGDTDGVRELLAGQGVDTDRSTTHFVHDSYENSLALEQESVDLLISLYAGFISEHCTQYLKIGGHLLVNPSHGDAAMAALDARYRLAGVVIEEDGYYRVQTDALGGFLVQKKSPTVTREWLHAHGKAVAYTQPAFAYIFQRIS